jgi:hypothetical protein
LSPEDDSGSTTAAADHGPREIGELGRPLISNIAPEPQKQSTSRLVYPPWSPTVGEIERGKQLRSMAAVAYMLLGPCHPLWSTLRRSESDAMAFAAAQDLVEALPALTRRRLLSTFAAITWPRKPRGTP